MELSIFRANECDDFFYVNAINCVFRYYIFLKMNNKNYLNRNLYKCEKRSFLKIVC